MLDGIRETREGPTFSERLLPKWDFHPKVTCL